jgi:hypothetical protein
LILHPQINKLSYMDHACFAHDLPMLSRPSLPSLWSLLLVLTILSLAIVDQSDAQTRYSVGNPTNEQQYMLELINRARADGSAEAARLGLSSLQEGPPMIGNEPWTIENSAQPLSWNPLLAEAAQGQADLLNSGDQFFLGVSPHTYGGETPDQRISDTGYVTAPYSGPTTPSGAYPGPENVAEEISQGTGGYTGDNLISAISRAHDGLFTDLMTPGRGHRETTMLGFFREVGIGISVGTDNQKDPGQPGGGFDSLYIVQDFSTQPGQSPLLTGVVYYDANGNSSYDPGEGISGVTVNVTGSSYYAVTTTSGAYSVPVPGDGTYNLTFSGPVATKMEPATVSNLENAKVDYVSADPAPTLFANISTRLSVEPGDNVLIGGFIVTGTGTKTILVRAIGPSLPVDDHLANPTLELHDSKGGIIASNDNWKDSPHEQAIVDTTIAPTNDMESAILRTVEPDAYTAIVRGVNNTSGVALVEVYDLSPSLDSKLANISTRGNVQTGDNVLIGGTIITGNSAQSVLVRALGPSLGIDGDLANPMLELHDGNGNLLSSNDDWRSTQEAEIEATGIPPSNDLESAIISSLAPGAYTAIVRGVGDTTGIGLVEFYALD